MILNEDNTLFLVIDIQEKLVRAIFNKDVLVKNSQILIESAQILDLPMIVTEQYPQGLGESIEGIKVATSQVFIKTDFNALTDELLFQTLQKSNKNQIVVFGIETHICVYQTVLSLLENGYEVIVVADACGSRKEFEYKMSLDLLRASGAKIETTEIVLFELLKSSEHPSFRAIQKLIKD